MDLVTVFQTFSSGEAQLVRSRLEAAGFMAQILHELSALSMEGYSMSTGGIKVQVPADQAADARALIGASDEPTS
jgi:hypothetical protein